MSTLRYAGLSDVGRRRRHNEDRWLADGPLGLFLVVDGLGGEANGDLASQMIVDSFPALLRRHLRGVSNLAGSRTAGRVQDLITALNEQVRAEGHKHPRLHGMGATIVFALVWDRQALIAHVGDSRAYLLHEGSLEQLTRDHSAVQRLVDEGKIKPEQAADHPDAGMLTQFIGLAREVKADVRLVELATSDLLLFCSDGLWSMLEPAELEGILSLRLPPEKTCQLLVDTANLKGGDDNITAIVVAPAKQKSRHGAGGGFRLPRARNQ